MPITNAHEFNTAPPTYMPETQFNFSRIDTRLNAMNLCLACLGRAGVANADSTNVDAQMASREIDRVSYISQQNGGQGWWFNRENNWEFTTDINGYIYVPNNVLFMKAARIGTRTVRDYAIRGGRLYDMKNHTFDLRTRLGNDPLKVDLVMQLPYEHLPPSAKMYIAYRAALNFSGQQEFDPNRLQLVDRSVTEAKIDMDREELHQQDHNYYRENSNMQLLEMMAGNGHSTFR